MKDKMDQLTAELMEKVTGQTDLGGGAHSFRKDGAGLSASSTEEVLVEPREDGRGFHMVVQDQARPGLVPIPVIITKSGVKEEVINSFDIGAGAKVTILAGCAVHNCGKADAQHDGLHTFRVGKGAQLTYMEKHYGQGQGGKRLLNPSTQMVLEEGAKVTLETTQIEGVDQTVRTTKVRLKKEASLLIKESLLTDQAQSAESVVEVIMEGEGSQAQIISRSVGKKDSKQVFRLSMTGQAACQGHIQCDSIIMDQAQVVSIPEVNAAHAQAQLIHEAAIGRIAGLQLTKLMTLGLEKEEAEKVVIQSFLNEDQI